MLILGINAYHGDAAAALFVDGLCVAAAAEERFTRVKHQAGFPSHAVRWCLDAAGADPADIDHVAISRNPSAHLHRKVLFAASRIPSMGAALKARFANAAKILDARAALADALGCDPKLLSAKFHRVEHHRAHLASALFSSPFDDAACLSVDGMGDFVSTMWGQGQGSRLNVKGNVTYPHSLGIYYTAFTQFLGMPKYGDEYKLMGLAAFGEPTFLHQLRDVVNVNRGMQLRLDLGYFLHASEGVDMTWADGSPEVGRLWSDKMAATFGPAREYQAEVTGRDRDLAASVQARLEEVELDILRELHRRTESPRLVLAGGVALNCVVNGKITAETPFEQVWVQPASTDDGTAVGAAQWVWHQVLGNERSWAMNDTYLGPEFSNGDYKLALENAGLSYRVVADSDLSEQVASRIADGAIVGWFQGRMEFGPRALGNRSIVCDPRRANMQDILNARIKHREAFRPFAPSVLEESANEWFSMQVPSPFMLFACDVKAEKRALVPAITHEDGTARIQTVNRLGNPRYYDLIKAFGSLTGVPLLLNTSFNENEPICCRPEEAVECFTRTQMDLLVLGNFVVDTAKRDQ